jgi:hypothetical protein
MCTRRALLGFGHCLSKVGRHFSVECTFEQTLTRSLDYYPLGGGVFFCQRRTIATKWRGLCLLDCRHLCPIRRA